MFSEAPCGRSAVRNTCSRQKQKGLYEVTDRMYCGGGCETQTATENKLQSERHWILSHFRGVTAVYGMYSCYLCPRGTRQKVSSASKECTPNRIWSVHKCLCLNTLLQQKHCSVKISFPSVCGNVLIIIINRMPLQGSDVVRFNFSCLWKMSSDKLQVKTRGIQIHIATWA